MMADCVRIFERLPIVEEVQHFKKYIVFRCLDTVSGGEGKTNKGQKARRRKQWQIRIKFSAYQEMLPMRK